MERPQRRPGEGKGHHLGVGDAGHRWDDEVDADRDQPTRRSGEDACGERTSGPSLHVLAGELDDEVHLAGERGIGDRAVGKELRDPRGQLDLEALRNDHSRLPFAAMRLRYHVGAAKLRVDASPSANQAVADWR